MKQHLKFLCLPLLLLLLCLFPFTAAKASGNTIESIDITASLNQDGSADITEIWDVDVNSGTEWYLVQGNLGKIEIENFSVTDESGLVYENEGSWDVNRSLEEKAGKCGIVDKGNGSYELCFGVGSYGSHIFTVTYHMTDFIKGFDDYCGFNQRFINDKLSSNPRKISVTVKKPDTVFTAEDVAVWAFGFEGTIYVTEGVVSSQSNSSLSSDDYVNIMCRFPREMFQTTNIVGGSFSSMQERAFEGSDYKSKDSASPSRLSYILSSIYQMLLVALSVISLVLAVIAHQNSRKDTPDTFEASMNLYKKWENRKLFRNPLFWLFSLLLLLIMPVLGIFYLVIMLIKKSPLEESGKQLSGKAYLLSDIKASASQSQSYYRDIPLKGNICGIYAALQITGLNSSENDIIGAYLLRWLQQGHIEFTKTQKNGSASSSSKGEPSVLLKSPPSEKEPFETELYLLLSKASGGDNILQEKELYKWAKKHYTEMKAWIDKASVKGNRVLTQMNVLHYIYKPGFFNMRLKKQDAFTELGRQELLQLYGFKNYLKDFTLMQEREPVEVNLWDDYLVTAQLFGMADKVAETFQKLYPSHFTDQSSCYYNTNYDMLTTFYLLHALSNAGAKGAQSGASAAASASSGGGGFSSSGGGGGFSGGGSGGGSR